jgi:hypothetical protein
MALGIHFYNHVRSHGKIKHESQAKKLANYYKECTLTLDFDRPQIAAKPFDKARFFEKEFLPLSSRKNTNCFKKIPCNLDYQIGVTNFADQKMMEITKKMLFLVTIQSNYFTLFVLKLGGDGKVTFIIYKQ